MRKSEWHGQFISDYKCVGFAGRVWCILQNDFDSLDPTLYYSFEDIPNLHFEQIAENHVRWNRKRRKFYTDEIKEARNPPLFRHAFGPPETLDGKCGKRNTKAGKSSENPGGTYVQPRRKSSHTPSFL